MGFYDAARLRADCYALMNSQSSSSSSSGGGVGRRYSPIAEVVYMPNIGKLY